MPVASSQQRGSLQPLNKHQVLIADGWSEADLGPIPTGGRPTGICRAGTKRTEAGPALTSPLLRAGLLLQEMTMAGLHELRFTEEKPLLRGQDAELVSLVITLALAPASGAPGHRGLGGVVCCFWACVWYSVQVLGAHLWSSVCACWW